MIKTLKRLFAAKSGLNTYGQIENMLTRRGDIVR
jgi:hypothetical protein